MRLGADDVDDVSLSWRLGGVKGFIVVLDGDFGNGVVLDLGLDARGAT
jgi:hypothetical protein